MRPSLSVAFLEHPNRTVDVSLGGGKNSPPGRGTGTQTLQHMASQQRPPPPSAMVKNNDESGGGANKDDNMNTVRATRQPHHQQQQQQQPWGTKRNAVAAAAGGAEASAMERFHSTFQAALTQELEALVRDLQAAAGSVADPRRSWGGGVGTGGAGGANGESTTRATTSTTTTTTATAVDGGNDADGMRATRAMVGELVARWSFVLATYRAHVAAEDEVVLPALAARVNNVAHAYELEHHMAEDELFDGGVTGRQGDTARESASSRLCLKLRHSPTPSRETTTQPFEALRRFPLSFQWRTKQQRSPPHDVQILIFYFEGNFIVHLTSLLRSQIDILFFFFSFWEGRGE